MHFRAFNDGSFTHLAYKHGSKKEAFAAAIISCRKNPLSCSNLLTEMPDHPKWEELLKLATADCLSEKNIRGNFNCRTVGAYYFKKGQKAEAFKFWELGFLLKFLILEKQLFFKFKFRERILKIILCGFFHFLNSFCYIGVFY